MNTPEWRKNVGDGVRKKCQGDGNSQWKGDDAKPPAMHRWIKKLKGTPKYCEHCERTDKKKYEWANKDHKYSRNPDDYMRLCTTCHIKHDITFLGKKHGGASRTTPPKQDEKGRFIKNI
jgi:hypothetical protein